MALLFTCSEMTALIPLFLLLDLFLTYISNFYRDGTKLTEPVHPTTAFGGLKRYIWKKKGFPPSLGIDDHVFRILNTDFHFQDHETVQRFLDLYHVFREKDGLQMVECGLVHMRDIADAALLASKTPTAGLITRSTEVQRRETKGSGVIALSFWESRFLVLQSNTLLIYKTRKAFEERKPPLSTFFLGGYQAFPLGASDGKMSKDAHLRTSMVLQRYRPPVASPASSSSSSSTPSVLSPVMGGRNSLPGTAEPPRLDSSFTLGSSATLSHSPISSSSSFSSSGGGSGSGNGSGSGDVTDATIVSPHSQQPFASVNVRSVYEHELKAREDSNASSSASASSSSSASSSTAPIVISFADEYSRNDWVNLINRLHLRFAKLICVHAVEELEKRPYAIKAEGLFRVSGKREDIINVQQLYHEGKYPLLSQVQDENVLTGKY